MTDRKLCSIDGCGKSVRRREWCTMHYSRWLRHGDPLGCVPDRADRGSAQKFLEEALLYQGNDCLIWPYAKDNHGYGKIWHRGQMRYANRIVCLETNGPPPSPKHESAHSCGRGHEGCINPRHLSWKTKTENMADCVIHGTRIQGEKHHNAKLTEESVLQIRALKNTLTNLQLAELFGVNHITIRDVITGRSWSWL